MTTVTRYTLVLPLIAALAIAGCAQQPKSANSAEAIQKSQELKTVEEKTQYLVSEANAFINSQKFEDAIATAKHILSKLDAQSVEAKGIIEKAQAELKKLAEKKMEEVKGDLQNKLGIGK